MLPEYTILVAIFLIIDFVLDWFVLKTKLLKKPRFWVFLGFVVALQTIFDNWLNGRYFFESYIVGEYNFYSGIRIWHTPLENYFYGIGLVWMNLIVFEYLIRKKNERSN
jgi:hypothetical protein